MPFRALNLSPQILQAVRDAGYTEPTPIQVAAIPLILAGDDVIGIAQTGTGKTGLIKNMIIQDIQNGEGVCFIDPHGNDIEAFRLRG